MPSVKNIGKPYAGKLHVRFDEGGQVRACSLLYPVYRPFGVPSISHHRAGLRNSHDPLRGHVLKQCSPNPTARSRLIEAVHRGQKIKTQKPETQPVRRAMPASPKKKRAQRAHKAALDFHFP
jgi:hypothetical protein